MTDKRSAATGANPTTDRRLVIDRPCPKCGRASPHTLTDNLLSECLNCGARWL
jgi:hypothetical protein